MLRLNLGCGNDVRSGYVNVDFRKSHGVDLVHDLSELPWPFETESADEIMMLDFLEHFPYRQTHLILMECHRILKADGTVVIQVPDAEVLSRAISGLGGFPCNVCGRYIISRVHDGVHWLEGCPECGQNDDDSISAAMKRLFGGQDYDGNFHHACFTRRSLMLQAREAGLIQTGQEEVEHQYLNWNFKSRFKKGDLW